MSRVGFVAQSAPVYSGLTVDEHLMLGDRLNPRWDMRIARDRIESTGLDSRQRAGRLSGGQRAQLAASPLARTPYDLRHAAVSTWLNGGVPPTDVAAWAGHSVEVLLKIYAKCLDGDAETLRQRVQALGHGVLPATVSPTSPVTTHGVSTPGPTTGVQVVRDVAYGRRFAAG